MSRKLATACACITALLWLVALRYGNFSRKAQRTYQDALAETNQVRSRVLLIWHGPDCPHVSYHQASWQLSPCFELIQC